MGKQELVEELLRRTTDKGCAISVSRARRLVSRALNEPDPLAYALTYCDPVGEHATARAARSRHAHRLR